MDLSSQDLSLTINKNSFKKKEVNLKILNFVRNLKKNKNGITKSQRKNKDIQDTDFIIQHPLQTV
jgi:hypothetical protein